MGVVRAQVRFEGDTLDPEDVFINTWHFLASGGALTEGVADTITSYFDSFYKAEHGGQPGTIAEYFSPFMSGNAEVRYYDLAHEEPRVPIIRTFTFTPVASGGLPAEVAVALSFQAGIPLTRTRRGRVYLGPLNQNAMSAVSTSDRHVNPTFMAIVGHAAADMAVATRAHRWAIYSRKLDSASIVETGWVDDAFDTQRRRGNEALTRVTFIGGGGIAGPFLRFRVDHRLQLAMEPAGVGAVPPADDGLL